MLTIKDRMSYFQSFLPGPESGLHSLNAKAQEGSKLLLFCGDPCSHRSDADSGWLLGLDAACLVFFEDI